MIRTFLTGLAIAAFCGAQVSPESPLYLYAHFRDTDQAHLRFSYSPSATDWKDVNPRGSFSAQALRDPSIMYVPSIDPNAAGTFCFIVTPALGTLVQFFSSQDLVNFSTITTIDMGAMVPGAAVAWAPEWWHDPQDGNFYFFIAISTDPDGAASTTAQMTPWLVPFDPVAGAVTGAAVPVALSGTTQGRTFDFFPYFDGAQYHLLYVDQQPGGGGANVIQPIAWATSPNLEGPYTQQTCQGTDYFGLGTFQSEAPTIVRLGQSGCVRVVFDTWTVAADGARDYAPVYRDSCLSGGGLFSQTSLVDGPDRLVISASEHGTIIPLTDNSVAAIVYAAAGLAQGPPAGTRSGSF